MVFAASTSSFGLLLGWNWAEASIEVKRSCNLPTTTSVPLCLRFLPLLPPPLWPSGFEAPAASLSALLFFRKIQGTESSVGIQNFKQLNATGAHLFGDCSFKSALQTAWQLINTSWLLRPGVLKTQWRLQYLRLLDTEGIPVNDPPHLPNN